MKLAVVDAYSEIYSVDIFENDWKFLGEVNTTSNDDDAESGSVGFGYMDKQLSKHGLDYGDISIAAQLTDKSYRIGAVSYEVICQLSVACIGHLFFISPKNTKTLFVIDVGYADE